MIRLLRSELLRARSRRLVPMLIVGFVLVITIGLIIAATQSHKPSPEEVAQAQVDYQQNLQRCKHGRFTRDAQTPPGYGSVQDYCEAVLRPSVDSGIQLADLGDAIQGSATFTVLIGVILGASLGGADWSAGTMTTLLTWEPRRIRVLLTRAVVVAVFVFVISLALQLLFAAGWALVASIRGWTGGTPPGFAGDVGRVMVRVSTMAIAFGVVAMSIATVGRSTVAALGVLVGYLVLFEGVIAGFSRGTQDKMLVRAAGVVVSRMPIIGYHETTVTQPGGLTLGSSEPYVLLGIGEAWVVVGFYVLLLLGLALLAFRVRDVN